MYRVGKSATETEAETWESDLISVRSCACMTGCFVRTHVFVTFKLSCMLPTVHLRVNSVATRLLWINTSEFECTMPRGKKEGCLAVFKAHPDNCYYLISAFIPPPVGAWMPSLLSTGAVSRMCTQQLLHLEVTHTQWVKYRVPALSLAFQIRRIVG